MKTAQGLKDPTSDKVGVESVRAPTVDVDTGANDLAWATVVPDPNVISHKSAGAEKTHTTALLASLKNLVALVA